MVLLTERYAKQIEGVLSCLDRLVITGTLPGICHARGMESYLRTQAIRIFDYPRFAEPLRDEIRENAERLAQEHGLQIEYIRSLKSLRKEDRIQQILEQRGSHPGLVHIFSAMESCSCFERRYDRQRNRPYLQGRQGKCLHYYFYFIDPQFGLCYLRVPTWAPFRLQFYCNGHAWLANRLRAEGISFRQLDNAFAQVGDWGRAQQLADAFPVEQLHRALDGYAARFCPVVDRFETGYHWSLMQVEYATDIVFRRQRDLRPVYDALVHTAIHAVRPDHVATFLGRPLHPLYAGELGNDFHTRIEGTRIRHHMGPAAIKMYDKHALVLRIETTVNDVSFFRHHRQVEHRNGTTELKLAPVQKTIYSLGPLRELLVAANRRYLCFLSELADPAAGVRQVERLSQPVRKNNRPYRGFNLFDGADLELFRLLARGEWHISGFKNASLRRLLPGKTGAQVSRLLQRLRLHGLITKRGLTYKYYLTRLGQRVLMTALKLRELVVIPSLAGILQT